MKNCYAKCIVFLLFETGTDIDHATVLTIACVATLLVIKRASQKVVLGSENDDT
jgi:hypothetical protein